MFMIVQNFQYLVINFAFLETHQVRHRTGKLAQYVRNLGDSPSNLKKLRFIQLPRFGILSTKRC